MKRKIIKVLSIIFLLLVIGFVILLFYIPPLSKQAGVVESKLFLGKAENQPLIVAFGGGGGGNDWARDYMKERRDSLNEKGYAVLAIGYFNCEGTPKYLDRISLNAIVDTILSIAKHPNIDETKIALIGGSRGGELVLNLGSRFNQFKTIIALSTSNVSFPAITLSANTSSWTYNEKAVAYIPAPFKTIFPALKGDLYTAHTMMLEDKIAVSKAEIPVENIEGAVLLVSGKKDDQWPAAEMADQIMARLQQNNFPYPNQHIKLEGGHTAPLNHFDIIYDFLDKNLMGN